MRLRPPPEVRERVGRERVLAWLPSGGSSVVATERALLLPEGTDPPTLPWDRILHASWDATSIRISAQVDPQFASWQALPFPAKGERKRFHLQVGVLTECPQELRKGKGVQEVLGEQVEGRVPVQVIELMLTVNSQ